jgi:hypothetical protein
MPRPTSSTARGYTSRHRATRRRLLPHAYGKPCPLCGELMLKGQALDLDHSVPLIEGGTKGDRITHASCNRSAGGHLAAQRRREALEAPRMPTSRTW